MEVGEAGEEHEGTPATGAGEGQNLLRHLVEKGRGTGNGHVARNIENRLPRKIEGRWKPFGLRRMTPEPATRVVERALDRQGRGGQNDASLALQQTLAHHLTDVDGRAPKYDRSLAHLAPGYRLRIGVGENPLQVEQDLRRPPGKGHRRLVRLGNAFEVDRQAPDLFPQGVVEPGGSGRLLSRDDAESVATVSIGIEELLRKLTQGAQLLERSPARRSPLPQGGRVSGELLDTETAHRHAEVLSGHVFDLMRFLQYQKIIVGQYFAVGALSYQQIGKQEMVVDDDDVALRCLLSEPSDPTPLKIPALLADTGLALGGDSAPELDVLRKPGDLGPIARFRHRSPTGQRIEVIRFGKLAETWLDGKLIVSAQTDVVGSSLHERSLKRHAQRLSQERKILVEELFLKVLGSGGNDHPLSGQDGGDEVGQRLAGAGSRLDQQLAPPSEGGGHPHPPLPP